MIEITVQDVNGSPEYSCISDNCAVIKYNGVVYAMSTPSRASKAVSRLIVAGLAREAAIDKELDLLKE